MQKHNLIMLPGWGMNSSVWDKINKLLVDSFELIFIEWQHIHAIEDFKNIVINSIKEREITSFSILGWSLGSLVAQDIVVNSSLKVESLILLGGTSSFAEHKETGYTAGWNKRVIERMKLQLKKDMKKTLLNFNSAMFSESEIEKKLDDSFLKNLDSIEHKNVDELLLGLDYLINMDLRNKLEESTVPMLMIHGEEDSICPLEAAKYLKDVDPNSRLEIIKNTGHVPFFTEPEYCSRLIQEFISENTWKKGM